jgi:hypothetical protein
MGFSNLWSKDSPGLHFEPPGLHFEPPGLHCERSGPYFEPLKLLNFDFNADSDLAFYTNADPDPAEKKKFGAIWIRISNPDLQVHILYILFSRMIDWCLGTCTCQLIFIVVVLQHVHVR